MDTLTTNGAPMLVVPELFALYFLTHSALAQDAPTTSREASFVRESNHRDFIFTPEVSLGPAFRSLAPPRRQLS